MAMTAGTEAHHQERFRDAPAEQRLDELSDSGSPGTSIDVPLAEQIGTLGPRPRALGVLEWLQDLKERFRDAPAEQRLAARGVAVERLREVEAFEHPEKIVDRALGFVAEGQRPARWPAPLANEAFHGPAGRFVATVAPVSEADPAALLFSYLVTAGALFGPRPHVRVESTLHAARLFAVLVGRSSTARKGTAQAWVEAVARMAVTSFDDLVHGGLGSGEGIIHAVRDSIVSDGKVIDPGVAEKRLQVVEQEFGRILAVMGRQGSILSQVLRGAWDNGRLQNMTKNAPERATGVHVSIMAHVTAEELVSQKSGLDSVSAANGFGNRFMWVAVTRSKSLAFGGTLGDGALTPLAAELREAVAFAQGVDEVHWSATARPLWEAVYDSLSQDRGGFMGALLARAPAQVLRLALIYALLDQRTELGPEHVEAAVAAWDYAQASALYVFGDQVGHPLAEKLLKAIRDSSTGLTRSELYDATGRHARRADLDQALGLLTWQGLAFSVTEPTGGRSREIWVAAQ